MERSTLAALLAESPPSDRAALIAQYSDLIDANLAQELRAIYFDSYSSEPQRAASAAHALSDLAATTTNPEIHAIVRWIEGLAALQLEGRLEHAIACIDSASASFAQLGQEHTAATTQISKIFALARLGRYDEAVDTGLRARKILLAHNDTPAVGRIELNLGNLADRRGQYEEAAAYYRAARERFRAAGDQRMLAYVNNGLANILSQQHQFHAAASLYEQALAIAEEAGLEVTRAEVECNLGAMALFQGRYDQALAFLERSRRRYSALDMPHESAIAELELADAYMELNLAIEAAAIYGPVIDTFAQLGMRAEQARALLNYGRACLQLGRIDEAWVLLAEADSLYASEGNPVGVAMVALAKARLCYREGDYPGVIAASLRAEKPLAAAGVWDQLLALHWLYGEAARLLNHPVTAELLLRKTLIEAEQRGVSQIALHCHTSLGRLAIQAGNRASAEASFLAAIRIGEALRAPLPADELRAALAAEVVAPFNELVRLCLDDSHRDRTAEAMGYAERGRARAMIEMLGGATRLPKASHDPTDSAELARLAELRNELNWLYNRISRPPDDETSPSALTALYEAARKRETAVAELRRRMTHTADTRVAFVEPLDLASLQANLGEETALVEYIDLDGELAAFVVTRTDISVVRRLGTIAAVEAELARFRFQVGTLSYGAGEMRRHMKVLTGRVQHHLRKLYDILLRLIEPLIGNRRIVIVPYGTLHYVPFHALYDGESYVVSRHEVCCVPSAEVLHYSLTRPRAPMDRALLLGVADEQAPRASDEAAALAPRFSEAVTLLDDKATIAALTEAAPDADVLHLACHASFRPDNPLFSALHLGDGWLSVHDIYGLDLHCQLVTLSACETGVNTVAPGNELLGLARGFFLADTPTLVVSQWRVDDEATAALMADFYERLGAGNLPAAALRQAQLNAMERQPHPFFWAAFTLMGRW